MISKSLTEIANNHGTDKGTMGPSLQWNAHNYTDVYDAYLEKFRYGKIAILEVGLGVTGERWEAKIVHGRNSGGASIKMWYDYFPNGKIFGIDINSCPYLDNDRIKTFVADQGNVAELEAFMKQSGIEEFDFIIDDGSHRPDHQQITFSYFFKKLKSGGLYIIEDLQANGKGDGKKNRFSAETVLNTRKILKNFKTDGKFLEPNALTDTKYLADNIDYINFHCPKPTFKLSVRVELKRPLRKNSIFIPNTERVCVMRKK